MPKLTKRPKELPAWDALSSDQKKPLGHEMEVYAALHASNRAIALSHGKIYCQRNCHVAAWPSIWSTAEANSAPFRLSVCILGAKCDDEGPPGVLYQ